METGEAEQVFDSPNEGVARQVRQHLATGASRPGRNDLVLTTRGRRTGKLRRTMLIGTPAGEHYLVAASNAGADRHPAWYLNIIAEPRVTAQVGAHLFEATARTATAAERPALWQLIVAGMPVYQDYQRATAREIPVVIIAPQPVVLARTTR